MTEPIKLPPLPEPKYIKKGEIPTLSVIEHNYLMAEYGQQCARAAIEADRQSRNCGQCVPLSTDGTAVFIDGVGEVPLDFSGQARGDLASKYQEKIRALEAENYAHISESDNRQANNLESLTPAEAVFAFASWLTGRSDPVTLSSRHGAAIAVDLAVAFNESQGLYRFREDFHKYIKPYPAEKDQQARSEPSNSAGYTLGPVSDGGFDPRDRGEPVAEVPEGWREQFKEIVYDNLAAADNQDVPLEEYPDRILEVLDGVVGPRHPTVVLWRNDAIKTCMSIAYKYCPDPETYRYLKQDFEALMTEAPQPQQQAGDPVAWEFRHNGFWVRTSEPEMHKQMGRPVRPLYTTPQPQQIPEGYKLVPIEPTPEMLKSGWAENDVPLALRWKAMLEAAPQPQQIPEDHSGSTQMFLDALTLARDNARGFMNKTGPDTDSLPEIDLAIDTARAMLEADRKRRGEPVTVRKVFICAACEGVYADQPVSQCDCMPEKDEFIEGTITYPSSATPQPNKSQKVTSW